jgi:hypothetical protein
MTAFLLAIRDIARFGQDQRFSLVKTFRFETKSRCSEIEDFAILSLARLPISRTLKQED